MSKMLLIASIVIPMSLPYECMGCPDSGSLSIATSCNTAGPTVLGSAAGTMDAGPFVYYYGPTGASVWIAPVTISAVAWLGYTPDGGTECWAQFGAVANGESTSVELANLSPGTLYTYRVILDGMQSTDAGGSFTTGAEAGAPFVARFAGTSCMNENDYPAQNGWTAIAAETPAPKVLIELGDTHYANSTIVATVRSKTMAQRRVPEYRSIHKSTMTLGTWDDHDYCCNDCVYANCAGHANALATWKEFWIQPDYGIAGEALYHSVQYGDAEFFILDCRSERDANSATDDASKTMLSEQQWTWLEDGLALSAAKFKFVACGSTTMASNYDGWRLYTAERLRLYGQTKTVPGIIFLTGDIHSSQIEKRHFTTATAGYPIHEAVSSGVGVQNSSGANWRWYTIIDVDTTAQDPTVDLTVRRYDANLVLSNNSTTQAGIGTYVETYYVSKQIKLSDLQLADPAITWVMQVTNDRVDIPDHADFTFGQKMSACAWVRPDSLGVSTPFFRQWGSTAANRAYQFNYGATGKLAFYVNSTSAGYFEVTTNCALTQGAWAMVCATYDGTQGTAANRVRIYKDGSECTTTGGSAMPASMTDSAAPAIIGDTSNISATIDSPTLWSTTLTGAEITTLYSEWVANTDRNWCDEDNVRGSWSLEETYTDCTGRGHNGSAVNYPFFRQEPPL